MIVRNLNDLEVVTTTCRTHGGAVARMILTHRELEAMDFLAFDHLEPGKTIEDHIDPYEEIYFILSGKGMMRVDDQVKEVKPGDAVWLPKGVSHGLQNHTGAPCQILVAAATPR